MNKEQVKKRIEQWYKAPYAQCCDTPHSIGYYDVMQWIDDNCKDKGLKR